MPAPREKSRPGLFGSVEAQFGGGVFGPTGDNYFSDPAGQVVTGFQGMIGGFVSDDATLSGFGMLQPSFAFQDGVGFALQGYIGAAAQYYFAEAPGTLLEGMLGFGGGGAFGVYGGYGPMFGVGVKHVAETDANLHPTIGGQIITSLATSDGELLGVYALFLLTGGFAAY